MKTSALYKYQEKVSEFIAAKNQIGLFIFYGGGKTYLTLNWLEEREKAGESMYPCCILCSKSVMSTWKVEIAKHTNLIAVALEGTLKQRIDWLQQVAHIYLATYDCFKTRKVKTEGGYKVKRKSEFTDYLVEKSWKTVVADESRALASTKTARFKSVQQVFSKTRHRAILCGKPIAESVEEIFGQMYFLDQGSTFGRNYWEWKGHYFSPGPPWNPFDYVLKEGSAKEIADKIRDKCIMISKDEIMSQLPPKVYMPIYLEFDEKTRADYDLLKKEFAMTLPSGDEFFTKFAITQTQKLHQICSGFIYRTNELDEMGKQSFERIHNLKLDWLEENLEEIIDVGSTLIWTSFRIAVPLIAQVCEKLTLNFATYTSELRDEEKHSTIVDFQSGKFDVLVISEGLGYAGLNLQRACNAIYFNTAYQADWRQNSEDRCHRIGSEIHDSITYYDLIIKDSIDEVVLKSIKEKTDLAESIYKHLRGG